MRNPFFKRGFFQTLDRPFEPFGRNRQTGRGAWWIGKVDLTFWDFLVVVGGWKKMRAVFFRKAALGSCLLWDNWVIFLLLFLLLFLWVSLLPFFWLPFFWLVLFWLAFLPLLVHLLGNRRWCPSQCCCGAFPPRG